MSSAVAVATTPLIMATAIAAIALAAFEVQYHRLPWPQA